VRIKGHTFKYFGVSVEYLTWHGNHWRHTTMILEHGNKWFFLFSGCINITHFITGWIASC
jgi:hypothetical protein